MSTKTQFVSRSFLPSRVSLPAIRVSSKWKAQYLPNLPTAYTVASRISPRTHPHTLLLYCDKHLKFNDVVKKCLPNTRDTHKHIYIYCTSRNIRCAMCILYIIMFVLCMDSGTYSHYDLCSTYHSGIFYLNKYRKKQKTIQIELPTTTTINRS